MPKLYIKSLINEFLFSFLYDKKDVKYRNKVIKCVSKGISHEVV